MEKATFIPAVYLTTGDISKEFKRFVNRVADLIARKRKERYCNVVRRVRTRIRFAMLRTTLIVLRGKKKNMRHLYQKSHIASSLQGSWRSH